MNNKKTFIATAALLCIAVTGCANSSGTTQSSSTSVSAEPAVAAKSSSKKLLPGDVIDLSYWNITIPTDIDNNGKPDKLKIPEISGVEHPDFFYVNGDGHVVFASPNKACLLYTSPSPRDS